MKLIKLPLSEVVPPANPVRCTFDEEKILELAHNIELNGLVVPLGVKKAGDGYEVTDGHRRLLACRKANIAAVNCILRDEKECTFEAAKINENLWREELSPAEEAAYYAELMEQYWHDVDKVAEIVGQRRAYVEGRLLLLTGDPVVLKALVEKRIGIGVAGQLNRLRRENDRAYLLGWAEREGATVEKVSAWVQTYNARPDSEPIAEPKASDESKIKEPPESNLRCWICQSSEEPWDMRIVYEHSGCRRVLDRQAAAATREAVKSEP